MAAFIPGASPPDVDVYKRQALRQTLDLYVCQRPVRWYKGIVSPLKEPVSYTHLDFSIQTWVENVYRLFTDRNFAIIDKEGKKIGYSRSVWAMISMNTRKPADLLALHSGSIVDYVCDEPCPIEKPSRIKVCLLYTSRCV